MLGKIEKSVTVSVSVNLVVFFFRYLKLTNFIGLHFGTKVVYYLNYFS